jgi:hypothetical protein
MLLFALRLVNENEVVGAGMVPATLIRSPDLLNKKKGRPKPAFFSVSDRD